MTLAMLSATASLVSVDLFQIVDVIQDPPTENTCNYKINGKCADPGCGFCVSSL